MPKLHILPGDRVLTVAENENLLAALRSGGIFPDAPCGGNGICGKCRMIVDGYEVLACRTEICRDMTVAIPESAQLQVLQEGKTGASAMSPAKEGYLLAVDVGTTSVVCYLLDGKTGSEIAQSSMLNPQVAFGGDVVSRIQAALRGEMEKLTMLIRDAVASLIRNVCADAGIQPSQIGVVSLVGNPAMFHPGTSAKTMQAFHDCLLDTYIETFGSARNAIFRLKENWHCMIFLFEDSEKLWKKLRKTTDIAEYRAITAEIFESLPMRNELEPDW